MARQVVSKLIPCLLSVALSLSACLSFSCRLEEPTIVSGELEERVDRSLLTGKPCAPPCWYGITPGITSDDEALDILKGLEFINPDTIIRNGGARGGAIGWKTIFPEAQSAIGGISFDQHGTVTGIGMTPLYHITLQALVDVIGEPDGIVTSSVLGYDGSPPRCKAVDVVWLDEGLEVLVSSLPISDKTPLSLDPSLYARHLTYFTSISSMRQYIRIQGKSSSDFVRWEGFDE